MTTGRLLASLAAALVVPVSLLVAPAAGAADASPRIVNGREPIHEDVASLVYVSAGGLCSGTLVDNLHVVTAAHCVANSASSVRSPSSIRVGWSDTTAIPPAVHAVTAVHVPDYSGAPDYANDIAVLRLALPIPGATPMPLASAGESKRLLAAGRSLRSAGYGATTPTGHMNSRAQIGDLRALPNSACRKGDGTYTIGDVTIHSPWVYEVEVNTTTAVCAIGVVPGTKLLVDSCQGDSGGSLTGGSSTRQRLVGVVSVGIGCAGFEREEQLEFPVPGIYTRIAPFLEWLTNVGVERIPEAPSITATSTGADAISVSFSGLTGGQGLDYRAVVSADGTQSECITGAAESACTVAGLTPGMTYTVTGYARGQTYESDASPAVTSVAGVPTARPSKPRIDSAKATPGRRLAITVTRIDPAGWTSTFVICSAGERSYRADVVEGRAMLTLPAGMTYRCYAKSTNEVGGTRSNPIRIDL